MWSDVERGLDGDLGPHGIGQQMAHVQRLSSLS
jgi:hypothetical protein